jgi:sugar phosphate isomerase/epimerase
VKLAFSNIAWNDEEEPHVLGLLRKRGVDGIEVAPTRLWPEWAGATPAAARLVRSRFAAEGFEIPSMQAILFGKPHLSLFGDRLAFIDHMRAVADLAAALGARVLVYGAPKSRDRGDLTPAAAFERAIEVLRLVAVECAARDTALCIEPNPAAYGCNFILESREGTALVRAVDSPGLQLHLDTAGMTLAGEDPAQAVAAGGAHLCHTHISEPHLAPIAPASIDHARIGRTLRKIGYRGWCAIEMRRVDDALAALTRAVDLACTCYGGRLHAEPRSAVPGRGRAMMAATSQVMAAQSPPDWQVPGFTVATFAPRRTKYCVVIPVINEGARFLNQIAGMAALDLGADVIIADGNSTDGSTDPERLRACKVRTVLTKVGPGRLSAQLRMGFAYALGEGYAGVVTIDGNGKDGFAAIPAFVSALDQGFDFVQGSRYIAGGSASNTPLDRALGVKFVHAPLLSLAAGIRYTDTTNGFRAFSARFLLDPRVQPFRAVFDTYNLHYYLAVRAPRLGFRVTELPVQRDYPLHGPTPSKIGGLAGKLHIMRQLLLTVAGAYNPRG